MRVNGCRVQVASGPAERRRALENVAESKRPDGSFHRQRPYYEPPNTRALSIRTHATRTPQFNETAR